MQRLRVILSMRSSTLALFFFLVTISLSAQEGDLVTLKDGSVIRGEVLSLEGGKLQLKTDFSATIGIQLEKIVRLEVSRALRFELKGEPYIRPRPAVPRTASSSCSSMEAARSRSSWTVSRRSRLPRPGRNGRSREPSILAAARQMETLGQNRPASTPIWRDASITSACRPVSPTIMRRILTG